MFTEISSELEGFNLYLTNDTDFTGMQPTYNSTGTPYDNGIYIVNFTAMGGAMLARYIYIALDDPGSLSLCEVRVFGGKFYVIKCVHIVYLSYIHI